MLPILLPLMITAHSRSLITAALIMRTFDLGLLTSPIWGIAAERYNLYRPLFFTGFTATVTGTVLLPLLHDLASWFVTAFLTGVGNAGAATLASLLIVDFSPRKEWEIRIGLLQSINGGGQLAGLLLSAVFSRGSYDFGLWIAGTLLDPALFIGRIGLPWIHPRHAPDPSGKNLRRLDVEALAPFRRPRSTTGVGSHIQPLGRLGLRRLFQVAGTAFGRFLFPWFMFALAVSDFFTYFPLMLADNYGLSSHLTASLYALGAAMGIGLFVIASQWSVRYSSTPVYRAGLWLRIARFILLLLPGLLLLSHRLAVGVTGFLLIVLAWPIISVSGTNLAVHLSPFSEGAAMGILNATLSLATVLGAFASGPMVRVGGVITRSPLSPSSACWQQSC